MKRFFAVLSLAVVFSLFAASCATEPKVEEADAVSDATSAATGEGDW